MSRYWLGLGANLGDRRAALEAGLAWLAGAGHRVEAVSPVYETAPRELADQPAFLNAAARVASDLDPPALLAEVKRMEARAGPRPGRASASAPARSTATCCCGTGAPGAARASRSRTRAWPSGASRCCRCSTSTRG